MAHGGFLRQHSDDPELASHIMHDYTKANLDPQTREMLDFATKLSREPVSMTEGDVQGLRGLARPSSQQRLGGNVDTKNTPAYHRLCQAGVTQW